MRPGEEPQRVLYLQGLAFAALARYDDAVEVYSLAIERDRSSAELYYRLAEAQLRAGHHPRRAARSNKRLPSTQRMRPSRALAPQVELALRDASGGLRK